MTIACVIALIALVWLSSVLIESGARSNRFIGGCVALLGLLTMASVIAFVAAVAMRQVWGAMQ